MFRACPCGGRIENKVCDRCGPKNKDRRKTASERGYDSEWRRFSLNYRRKYPLCVCCLAQGIVNGERGRTGTRVDHIVPLSMAPELKYAPSNLNTICESCDSTYKRPIEDKWSTADEIRREWIDLLNGMRRRRNEEL